MPLYEYQCTSCGRRIEVLQRLGEARLTECSSCGGALEKVISAPALQFKGSGWYVTDYARSGKAATADGDTSSKPAAAEKTAEKKAEPAKPAADTKPASAA